MKFDQKSARRRLPSLVLLTHLTLSAGFAGADHTQTLTGPAGAEPDVRGADASEILKPAPAESGYRRFILAASPSSATAKVRPGLARSVPGVVGRTMPPAGQAPARPYQPVLTALATGPGQAGYVHYFNVKMPDGTTESQVGIELPDQRIAWSFPELGVVVSPFIESGTVTANGKLYEIEHLYGIRPFPDAEAMRVLQENLLRRIIPWVEDRTPYCFLPGNPDHFCVSCLGFVMRVLFPGRTPAYPAVPDDFQRTGNTYYTTDDLLLYLVGLHGLPTHDARLKRIEELVLPQNLRDEALRLVNAPGAAPELDAADVATPPSVPGKNRAAIHGNPQLGQRRLPQSRKL